MTAHFVTYTDLKSSPLAKSSRPRLQRANPNYVMNEGSSMNRRSGRGTTTLMLHNYPYVAYK